MWSRRPLAAAMAVLLAGLGLAACGGGGARTTETVTVIAGGPKPAQGADVAAALVHGISQSGLMLGSPKAPATLVEYLDIDDPASVAYIRDLFPRLVDRFVRPGRLRIELRLQTPLGDPDATEETEHEDPVKIARDIVAAGFQGFGFQFAQLVVLNRDRPHEGDDLKPFLKIVAYAIGGLDFSQLQRDANHPASARPLRQAATEFDIFGLDATPAFRLGRTGGEMRPVSLAALRRAIQGGSLPYVG